MANYSELLKDPRWQRKRLEILGRDKFTCQACGDKENTLHVHHFTYKTGKLPWQYPDANFITLCEFCHTQEGLFIKNQNEGFIKVCRIHSYPVSRMWRMAFAMAFLCHNDPKFHKKIVTLVNNKLESTDEWDKAWEEYHG
jgi:hypothetical protein